MSYPEPPTVLEIALTIIALTAGGVIALLLLLQALN
jgi:hypothetical protein